MVSLYALQQEQVGPAPDEKLLLASAAARWGREGDAVAPARPAAVAPSMDAARPRLSSRLRASAARAPDPRYPVKIW